MNFKIPREIAIQEPRRKGRLLELRTDIPAGLYFLAGASFIGAFLLIWLILTALEMVPPLFLPGPKSVWLELARQIREGILMQDMAASLYRITLGWLVSTLLALPIGILMGNFKFFEGLFEPFIDLVRYMPAVAFVPLTILWTGVGDGQKILILFIGTFFQEVLMIMDNVKGVPREMIEVSSTFGLSRWKFYTMSFCVMPCQVSGIPSVSRSDGPGHIWWWLNWWRLMSVWDTVSCVPNASCRPNPSSWVFWSSVCWDYSLIWLSN